MMKIGRSGYAKNAKIILDACNGIRKAIKNEMPEILCATEDTTCVLTIVGRGKKDSINPLALKDVLKEHGWILGTI